MSRNQIRQAAPGWLLTVALTSSALVVPFAVLQHVNRQQFGEEFPVLLFSFMTVHALGIALSMTPALWRFRMHRRLGALSVGHWLGLGLAVLLLAVYAQVVIDQLPCFLGVPNCD